MKAVGLAIGLVVVLNAVVIVPAARERATPVHHVTVQACGDHISGGWRDGELPGATHSSQTAFMSSQSLTSAR